jgi:hypothetical protein
MANLYGRMMDPYHSGRREVTRTAATEIWARLETWEGAVDVTLDKNGDYIVRECQSKHGQGDTMATMTPS